MAGSTILELCGGFIFTLTRSVAEHFNPNEAEIDFETFGYDPLEKVGIEWNYYPVDELVYQEYSDTEATSTGYMAFNNSRPTLINACSTEDSENTPKATEDRAMAWKRLRPSVCCTIWSSLYFGFLISVLTAAIVGTLSITVYYFNYQAILICLDRPKESIPIKIQWIKTLSDILSGVFIHIWFFINTLFYFRPYQIMGVKRKLFLISFIFYALDSAYRVTLQGLGISHSDLTMVQRIPGNVLFSLGVCIQTWVLARHFFIVTGIKKLKTLLWMIGSSALTFFVAILVSKFIYPAYNKQNKTGKIYIAVFAPLITVILKGISRLCVQQLRRISHPGTSFILLVPLYYGSAVMLRLLQVDLNSWKSVALIGIIHGIAEVIERSVVVLLDYVYYQIYKRRLLSWGRFRTPRRERLATDIAIISMLGEASAVISVNGFLHLHEYYYTDNKTPFILLKSFVITTTVPLAIEWFFSSVSIAIETRYQNRPVMAVWRKHWKRHLVVALVNALPISVWTSTSLLIAIKGRFSNIRDYCEMPFTHP